MVELHAVNVLELLIIATEEKQICLYNRFALSVLRVPSLHLKAVFMCLINIYLYKMQCIIFHHIPM